MRIALTAGEPAGIGPDLVIQAAQLAHEVELVCIADETLLQQRAEMLGLPLTLRPFDAQQPPAPQPAGSLSLVHLPLAQADVVAGQLSAANASYVLQSLDRAVEGCLNGEFAAMVTGPVHKGIINQAGIPFTGHTEYLAERTATDKVVMMLAAPGLRVALATTHLPLARVSEAITAHELSQVIQVLHRDLVADFGIANPRILVCGLNPHAGEDGHLGREEIEVITPVLESYRAKGMDLVGPLPADSLFTPRYLQQADAVLAMYHDQGLPVLKHVGFGEAVNITLGLPIIRTSVDHGTALELAGRGQAETGSLQAAILSAIQMVTARGHVHS